MDATTKDGRTYRASLMSIAPYPLNWDTIAEEFDNLSDAMAQAEEWMKKYPKGIAGRTRRVEVTSYAGIRDVGHGSAGYRVEVGRKVHLDTRKRAKA